MNCVESGVQNNEVTLHVNYTNYKLLIKIKSTYIVDSLSNFTWHLLHVRPVSSGLQGHCPLTLSHTSDPFMVPVTLHRQSKQEN